MADIYLNNPDLKRAIETAGGRGGVAEDAYLQRAMAYDPQAAIQRSAEGAFNALRPQLGRSLRDMREDQVAAGRFGQGASFRAEDELTERAYKNLTDSILQNSMQGEQLRLRNMEGIGSFGRESSGDYLDALAGLTTSQYQQQQADKASKRSMWGNLLGAGLTAAGTVLGGPIGGAIASRISDKKAKKNVKKRAGGLEKVLAMNPVDYEYTDEAKAMMGGSGGMDSGMGMGMEGPQSGVIAQEMEQAEPAAVEQGPAGMKQVDPWPILADLIDAVQQLNARLEARNA